MQRMPNINLTSAEYQTMLDYCRYQTGGEGILFKGMRPDTLYKIFVDYETTTPIGLSDNKFNKVLAMYENPLEDSVQPLSTISIDGNLVGYEMTFDEQDTTLDQIFLTRKQLIDALKGTSRILQYYARNDITYGDVKSNNILINRKTKRTKFCDMDNVRYGQYPIDLITDHIESMLAPEQDIDERVDAYMHNLMTIQMLNAPQLDYDQILYQLSEGKFRKSYKKEASEALATMASPKPFNGEYIIQYVKK